MEYGKFVIDERKCMENLVDILQENSYPGRGIVVGKNDSGEPCVYYFIMGRSVNSRNRIFVECEDGIRTQAFDEGKLEDPSLIIYHPVRTMGDNLVVTNGDQTDTICDAGDFIAGCESREYEPDAPNFTPRISAILRPDGTFMMSILKAEKSEGVAADSANTHPRCIREYFSYTGIDAGCAYFLSTYTHDGNPLPTFSGEPKHVKLPTPQETWQALNENNKVSLYAKAGNKVSIFNKNLGD